MSYPGEKFTIYVVDDDSDDLENINEALVCIDCVKEVKLFQSVPELMAAIKEAASKPDLIVLDHQAPGTSGDKALEWLRQDPRFNHTALVIYSSHLTPHKTTELIAKGADLCFTKGMTMSEIRTHAEAFCTAAKNKRH